jgi:hypothetical protein
MPTPIPPPGRRLESVPLGLLAGRMADDCRVVAAEDLGGCTCGRSRARIAAISDRYDPENPS